MRRRIVPAAALLVVESALIAGMFAFSWQMARQERVWRERGERLSAPALAAIDVSMWWSKYWWVVVPPLLLGGVGAAALIVLVRKPAPGGAVSA
jgi:hypothetical protein